ncbi:MAG: hypothetical protein DI537_59690, partial [Stutzerimonas stutzeri]
MDFERGYRNLAERFGNGDLDRRHFLRSVAGAAMAAGLTGPLLSACAGGDDGPAVRFDGFGGVVQQSLQEPLFRAFTRATGTRIDQGSFANSDELLTRIMAEGRQNFGYWECGSEFDARRFERSRLLMPIDPKRVPRLADLLPKAVGAYRMDAQHLLGVPMTMTGLTIGYNSSKIDAAEVEAKGVQILLDQRHGKVLMGEDNWIKRIWYAALQSGQDPNAIADIDAVWAKISESRAAVSRYWHTGAEQMQLFASGETWLSDAWLMRVHALQKQKLPIASYQAPGLYLGFAAFAAIAGAPADPLYQMIDILLRPEVLIAIAETRGVPTALDPKKHQMPATITA